MSSRSLLARIDLDLGRTGPDGRGTSSANVGVGTGPRIGPGIDSYSVPRYRRCSRFLRGLRRATALRRACRARGDGRPSHRRGNRLAAMPRRRSTGRAPVGIRHAGRRAGSWYAKKPSMSSVFSYCIPFARAHGRVAMPHPSPTSQLIPALVRDIGRDAPHSGTRGPVFRAALVSHDLPAGRSSCMVQCNNAAG